MSEAKSTELQPAVHGLEFPVKYAQRDCGHFCEACARRDDTIADMYEALKDCIQTLGYWRHLMDAADSDVLAKANAALAKATP